MYLKSNGRAIALREGTLSGLGFWPGVAMSPQPAPPPPSGSGLIQDTPQDTLRFLGPGTSVPGSAFGPPAPRPPAPSSGGSFLDQLRNMAGQAFQGGKSVLQQMTGGGQAAPQAPMYTPPSSGSSMLPVLLIGGAAVAAILILRKK